jgi:hypothetical protein
LVVPLSISAFVRKFDPGMGVRVTVGVRVGVFVAPPPPLLIVAEKLLTVRPTPLTHGSKPICILVRYHEVLPKPEPRVIASRRKGFRSVLKLVIPDPTYDTTLFAPL